MSERNPNGTFKHGNVEGKKSKRGPSLHGKLKQLRDLALDAAPGCCQVLIKAAADGDTGAAHRVLQVAAAYKPVAPPTRIDGLLEARTAAERMDAVLAAVATGSLSIDLGRDLVGIIQARAQLDEQHATDLRLSELEARVFARHAA
jgi:hypothetical protein